MNLKRNPKGDEMKLTLMTASVVMMLGICSLSARAFAHANHSPDICGTKVEGLCAHVGYPVLNTQQAFELMVHFATGDGLDAKLITNVTADLWMEMGNGQGHASAPVQVRQLSEDHFLVSEAYFPMAGEWLVRVNFAYAGTSQQLLIPVQVP